MTEAILTETELTRMLTGLPEHEARLLRRLSWRRWTVPSAEVPPRLAVSLARTFYGGQVPRPGWEQLLCVCTCPYGDSSPRKIWFENQACANNLSWVMGASAWGRAPFVLKVI